MILKKKLRSKEKLREQYNRTASGYDKTRFGNYGSKYVDDVEKRTILKVLKGNSVLELGTGTARYGLFLANKGFNFIGIDIAEKMLLKSKEKAEESNTKISLIQMDAENLAFSEISFDNVICIHTFQYFLHPLKVLKEAFSVLKPGGRCIFSFESVNPLLIRLIVNTGLKTKINPHVNQVFYFDHEVANLFEKTGFKILHKVMLFSFPFSFYRHLPDFLMKFLTKFDNRIGKGMICIIVGQKPSQV